MFWIVRSTYRCEAFIFPRMKGNKSSRIQNWQIHICLR